MQFFKRKDLCFLQYYDLVPNGEESRVLGARGKGHPA